MKRMSCLRFYELVTRRVYACLVSKWSNEIMNPARRVLRDSLDGSLRNDLASFTKRLGSLFTQSLLLRVEPEGGVELERTTGSSSSFATARDAKEKCGLAFAGRPSSSIERVRFKSVRSPSSPTSRSIQRSHEMIPTRHGSQATCVSSLD